jgi:DNA transformation protein
MDNDAIDDLFAGLGPVEIKRMFGGKGIYHRGVIIGIVLDGEIMLKADARSAPDFEAEGCRQWKYDGKKGKQVAMPYWSTPDGALDDVDAMTPWARKAYEAGLRAGK